MLEHKYIKYENDLQASAQNMTTGPSESCYLKLDILMNDIAFRVASIALKNITVTTVTVIFT